MSGQYINSIKQSLGSQQLIHQSYKENIKVTCNSLNKNINNTKKEISLKDNSISIEMFDNYNNQLYNKANNKLGNINCSTKSNNSDLQSDSNSIKTSLSIDNKLYKDHLMEKTTGSLYSNTMADKSVSSSSNKDISNKKQIINSKTKTKTKLKPKPKPKPKPKSKAKIKNTLASSIDISSQSSFKANLNKKVKEDVKVSNKNETSTMISTATTLAISGNKMVDTIPQSQSISTKFSNQSQSTKSVEPKSSNNVNQSNNSLKSKSNSNSNNNNSTVDDQKLNDTTSESEKEIKDNSIKDSHIVSDSNNFVDSLMDTSTLNILSDSMPSFESSSLSNKLSTNSFSKMNDISDNENQLALSELFNSENLDGKITNPLNSYVTGSNIISNTESSTIYQSNLSCIDLPSSTNSPIMTSQVLSSSNEDIMKNLGVSTNDLILNDAFGPTPMTLDQEKVNLDPVNLLEGQTLDSLKDVSNLKSNNGSISTLLLNDNSEFNMASSIRSYQDILMNEKNNIENSQFSSTTTPLNNSTSTLYDKYIKNGNALDVSSSAELPSIVTKSKSPISKVEHELINYNGIIKSETLDSVMSSLPECYQEKSNLGHSSQGFFQNVKVESGSSQSFLQNVKGEPESSQSFLQNAKVESGSPAISIGSLYPSPLNPEILNTPSSVSNYFSSSYDSGSLETATNLLKSTLSSTSLIKTENVLSPMIPGTDSISPSVNFNSNNIGTPSLKINPDVITTPNTTPQNLKGISSQTVYNKELGGIQRPFTETFPKSYHGTIDPRQSSLSLPTGEATGSGQILSNSLLLENNSSVDLLKKKLMLEQANKMSSSSTVLPLIYQNQNINVLYVRNEDMTDVVNPSSPLDVNNNSNLQTNPLLMNANLRKNLKRRLNYYNNPLMSLHQYNNLKSLNHKKLMQKQALHRHSNILNNKDLYNMYSGLPSTMDSYYQNKLYARTASSSSPISSDGSIHHLPNVNLMNNYNYGLPLSVWNQQALDLSPQGDYKSISSNLDVASQGMNYLSPTTSTTTKLGSLYATPNYKTPLPDIKYPSNQNIDMLLEPSSINSPLNMNYGIMNDNAYPKDLNPLVKLNPYYIPTTLPETKDKSNNIDGMKPGVTVISQNNEKSYKSSNDNKLENESAALLNTNSTSSTSNDISSMNNILHDKIEKSNLRKVKKTKDLIKKKSVEELKKINKKKKVKGKEKGEIKTEDSIENLNLIATSTESISNLSSPLASQSSVMDDSVLTAQRKNNSCLITPIHTPTLSEDTAISSENDINPALVIPKMTSISTPKRKGNSISKVDSHIHTPVSPTTMNNLPYISTPPYTANRHTSTTATTTTTTASISKTSNTTSTSINKNSSKLHPHVSSALNNKCSKASSSYKNDPNNRLGHNAYTSLMKKDIQSKTNGIPKITLVPWADQNTYVYQIELGEKIVSRRFDNQFVNGTKLLNVAGLTRGKRDAILKNEPVRNVVKNAPFHLKGVWIPIERARILSYKYNIDDRIIYLLENNPSKYIENLNMWEMSNWYLTYSK